MVIRSMSLSTELVCVTVAAIVFGSFQQQPQFAAAVSRVSVDVVVEDRNGKFVGDLRPGDFVLFEDEKPQEILDVQLVELRKRPFNQLSDSDRASLSSPRTRTTQGRPASELGAIIFFVDLPGLYFQNKLRLADALAAMLEKIDAVSVPHAVYFVDAAGRLRELVPLTRDLGALREAASRLRAIPLTQSRDDLLAFLESDVGGMTRWSEAVQRRRAINTYGLLKSFVEYLDARPGRTALVWVSTGVDLAAYQTVARLPGGDPRDPTFRFYSVDESRTDLQEELHRAANTANVSIYSVDPSALHEFYGLPTSARAGTVADARGNSLRDAARETGGKSFVAWSELGEALDHIENDASSFYLLTYAPSHDATEGEYHEIRVEVDRPDVEVRARQGYVYHSDTDRRARLIRGALQLPGAVSGFDVGVEAIRARDGGGQAVLVVAIAFDLGSNGSGANDLRATGSNPLLFYATARNGDGKLVAQAQDSLRTPAEPQRSPAAPFVVHRVIWTLDPGPYAVRVAVLDPATGRLGAGGVDLRISDTVTEWDTSDPALLVSDQRGEMSTVVGGALATHQSAVVYVEVYNGETPTLTATISQSVDASPTGSAPQTLGRLQLERDKEGIHRGKLPLPVLEPGDYLLEVIVDDPAAGKEKVTSLPVHVFAGAEEVIWPDG